MAKLIEGLPIGGFVSMEMAAETREDIAVAAQAWLDRWYGYGARLDGAPVQTASGAWTITGRRWTKL